MQNTNNSNSEAHAPEPETLPMILGGFAYDRSDITDILRAATTLSEKLCERAQRLKDEDPQSERADLYILAMSGILDVTFRNTFEQVNLHFFPPPTSPEEVQLRKQAMEKFEALLDDFNIGLSQCVEGFLISD